MTRWSTSPERQTRASSSTTAQILPGCRLRLVSIWASRDVTVAAARRQFGDEALIGLSTHTVEQADAARTETVDYVAVGPVYATSTKRTGYAAVGLDMVSYAAARGDAPIVAIGGVTLACAPAVISAGATSVAVVSDLLTGGDPRRCVRDYARALEK